MPDHELNFFSMLGRHDTRTAAMQKVRIPDLETYSAALENGRDRRPIVGEKSVSYLYTEWADDTIDNIRQLHPRWEDLKIVILLRDPVERTYSHYLATVVDGADRRRWSAYRRILAPAATQGGDRVVRGQRRRLSAALVLIPPARGAPDSWGKTD